MILGIDTSCDDTSVAVYDPKARRVCSNVSLNQNHVHRDFGGVVPELASRTHAHMLPVVLERSLKQAGCVLHDLHSIAVTTEPGLIGALLTGLGFAKGVARQLNVALVPVNHLHAHLFSPFIGTVPRYPFLGLVVSGGHTAFYEVNSVTEMSIIGQTVDDAAGEAFDKCAKMLGLGFPGGQVIEDLARQGDPAFFSWPRTRVKMGEQYLSFSGLKTHVKKCLQQCTLPNEQAGQNVAHLCAGLQVAIVETLIQKLDYFLKRSRYTSVAVSGGVAQNSLLRLRTTELVRQHDIQLHLCERAYCSDNGAMVAYRASLIDGHVNSVSMQAKSSQKIQARAIKSKRE